MAKEKVKVEITEKRLNKDGRHTEQTITKNVPAKARKFFSKWGWNEVGPADSEGVSAPPRKPVVKAATKTVKKSAKAETQKPAIKTEE